MKKICIFLIVPLMFIILSILVSLNLVNGFNDFVYNAIVHTISPAMTSSMKIVSNLGRWFIYAPFTLLLLIIPKSRVKIGIPAALVLAASAIGNILLKNLFLFERPIGHRLINITGYGFPSGHAMNGTAFVGICAYLFCKYSYNSANIHIKDHSFLRKAPTSDETELEQIAKK